MKKSDYSVGDILIAKCLFTPGTKCEIINVDINYIVVNYKQYGKSYHRILYFDFIKRRDIFLNIIEYRKEKLKKVEI